MARVVLMMCRGWRGGAVGIQGRRQQRCISKVSRAPDTYNGGSISKPTEYIVHYVSENITPTSLLQLSRLVRPCSQEGASRHVLRKVLA